jgi:hypothetical protein
MDNGKLTIVEVKVLNIDGQDGEWISRGGGMNWVVWKVDKHGTPAGARREWIMEVSQVAGWDGAGFQPLL